MKKVLTQSIAPRILSVMASLALTASLLACQPPASFVATPTSSSQLATLTAVPHYNPQTGELKIQISLPFEPGFRTQAVQCNSISSFRVTVTGVGIDSALLPTSPTLDANGRISGSNCQVTATFASLPAGPARIISIEGYDENGSAVAGARIKGIVDLNPLPTGPSPSPNPGPSSAEVSQRTTPAAEVIERLIKDHGDKGKQLISKISSSALKAFIDSITLPSIINFSPLRYSYTVHPSLVRGDLIAADLIAANGDLSQLSATSSAYRTATHTVSGTITGIYPDDEIEIRVHDPISQRVDLVSTGDYENFSIGNVAPGNWLLEIRNNSAEQTITRMVSSTASNLEISFSPGAIPPTPSWSEVEGLYGGSVNNVARLSGTPSLAFAATTHGVYKSTNATAGNSMSWSLAGTNLAERNILSVYVKDENTIYAGTDGDGIYKSTDGGTSWLPISDSDLSGKSIYRLELAGGSLHAATSGGVLVQGAGPAYDWTPAGTGSPASEDVRDLTFDGLQLLTVIHQTLNAGVYTAVTPVVSWSNFTQNLDTASVMPLSVSTSSTSNFVVGGHDGRAYGCNLLNTPSCWGPATTVGTGPIRQLRYLSGPNQFIAASFGEGIKTSEPEVNYKLPTTWIPTGENRLNNPFALGFDTSNTSGTHLGGLLGLTDGGGISELVYSGKLNWEVRNQGLKAATIRDLAYIDDTYETGNRYVFAAVEGGGVWRYDGNTWTHLADMPNEGGSELYIQALTVDRNNYTLYAAGKGRVYMLTNAMSNTTWQLYNSNLPNDAEIVDLHAANQKVYAAVKDSSNQGLYTSCSYDGSSCTGSDWSRSESSTPVYSILAGAVAPNRMIMGLGNGHVRYSSNSGSTWTDLGNQFSGRPVARMAGSVRGGEVDYIYLASEGPNPELRSYDFVEEVWSNNISPGLDGDQITSVAADPYNANAVAVSTSAKGVYYSHDGTKTDPGWLTYNSGSTTIGLTRLPISVLLYSPFGLYLGTEGRGVYRDSGTEPYHA